MSVSGAANITSDLTVEGVLGINGISNVKTEIEGKDAITTSTTLSSGSISKDSTLVIGVQSGSSGAATPNNSYSWAEFQTGKLALGGPYIELRPGSVSADSGGTGTVEMKIETSLTTISNNVSISGSLSVSGSTNISSDLTVGDGQFTFTPSSGVSEFAVLEFHPPYNMNTGKGVALAFNNDSSKALGSMNYVRNNSGADYDSQLDIYTADNGNNRLKVTIGGGSDTYSLDVSGDAAITGSVVTLRTDKTDNSLESNVALHANSYELGFNSSKIVLRRDNGNFYGAEILGGLDSGTSSNTRGLDDLLGTECFAINQVRGTSNGTVNKTRILTIDAAQGVFVDSNDGGSLTEEELATFSI